MYCNKMKCILLGGIVLGGALAGFFIGRKMSKCISKKCQDVKNAVDGACNSNGGSYEKNAADYICHGKMPEASGGHYVLKFVKDEG